MDRLLGVYRGASSVAAIAALVVANLVPLAGVVFWGWDLWTILALYWAENGIVGLWNIARILRAEGPPPVVRARTGPPPSTIEAARPGVADRAFIAAFFVVHYGLFWFGHGIFVLVALPAFAPGAAGELDIRARLDLVVLGAIGLAISHGISYWTVFLGRGEYQRISPQAQAQAPYGRLLILHVTIIFGAIISAILGVPFGAMLVLVSLKLALDLAFHLREHRQAAIVGAGTSGPG
jgi:hypothetical protein